MSPIKVIAATALSIGMVAAAGVAGFAVVSSSSASATTDSITLLASESGTGQLPFYQPGDLPNLTTLTRQETVSSLGSDTAAQSTTSGIASTQPITSPVVSETPRASSSTKPSEITGLQARQAVLAQVSGTVISTTEVTHNGYAAFAVKINLADGSSATGYVDKKSGVVYDWDVVGAPATSGNSGGTTNVAPISPQTTERNDDDKKDSHKEDTHKSDSKAGSTSSHDNDGDDD